MLDHLSKCLSKHLNNRLYEIAEKNKIRWTQAWADDNEKEALDCLVEQLVEKMNLSKFEEEAKVVALSQDNYEFGYRGW